MLINELAKQSGLTRDTIRFYEKIDLIKTDQVHRFPNRYKDFTSETLEQLLVIKNLKESGFTLVEIKEMAHLYSIDSHSCPENIPKIKQKILDMSNKIKALVKMKTKLQKTVACCQNGCPNDCALDESLRAL